MTTKKVETKKVVMNETAKVTGNDLAKSVLMNVITATNDAKKVSEKKTEDSVKETNKPETKAYEVKKPEVQDTIPDVENIDDVLVKGKRGITNKTLVPFIKKYINNQKSLQIAYEKYPNSFIDACKYLNDNSIKQLQRFFGNEFLKVSDEQKELIKSMNPSSRHINYHQLIPALEECVRKNDENRMKLLYKHYPQYINECVKYVRKEYRETVKTALNIK